MTQMKTRYPSPPQPSQCEAHTLVGHGRAQPFLRVSCAAHSRCIVNVRASATKQTYSQVAALLALP